MARVKYFFTQLGYYSNVTVPASYVRSYLDFREWKHAMLWVEGGLFLLGRQMVTEAKYSLNSDKQREPANNCHFWVELEFVGSVPVIWPLAELLVSCHLPSSSQLSLVVTCVQDSPQDSFSSYLHGVTSTPTGLLYQYRHASKSYVAPLIHSSRWFTPSMKNSHILVGKQNQKIVDL